MEAQKFKRWFRIEGLQNDNNNRIRKKYTENKNHDYPILTYLPQKYSICLLLSVAQNSSSLIPEIQVYVAGPLLSLVLSRTPLNCSQLCLAIAWDWYIGTSKRCRTFQHTHNANWGHTCSCASERENIFLESKYWLWSLAAGPVTM